MLREVARLFREEPEKIEQNRAALMQRLEGAARKPGRVTIGTAELQQRRTAARRHHRSGQWRHARRAEISASAHCSNFCGAPACAPARRRYFGAVDITLHRICEGGIYDHLGGGFARYSVDERWLVPHFEKMLYDNAQLLELLAVAFAHFHKSALSAARARNGRLARARNDDR